MDPILRPANPEDLAKFKKGLESATTDELSLLDGINEWAEMEEREGATDKPVKHE